MPPRAPEHLHRAHDDIFRIGHNLITIAKRRGRTTTRGRGWLGYEPDALSFLGIADAFTEVCASTCGEGDKCLPALIGVTVAPYRSQGRLLGMVRKASARCTWCSLSRSTGARRAALEGRQAAQLLGSHGADCARLSTKMAPGGTTVRSTRAPRQTMSHGAPASHSFIDMKNAFGQCRNGRPRNRRTHLFCRKTASTSRRRWWCRYRRAMKLCPFCYGQAS